MENFITFLIIAAGIIDFIISVWLLVRFIGVSNDIKTIKEKYIGDENFKRRFLLYMSMGMKEDAKNILMDEVMGSQYFDSAYGKPDEDSKVARENILKGWRRYFKVLNLEPSFEVIDRFYE